MLNEKALTTGQVADYCHVSQATVLKWIKNGDLKAYQIPSGYHRILGSDFREFLEDRGMPIDEAFLAHVKI
jgi:excisionase family DNA binding protein